MLPFETATQFVALGLTLLAGLLVGMGIAPGGRRWRRRYEEEHAAHLATRDRLTAELRDSNERIRAFEADRIRPVPVVAATGPVNTASDSAPLWRGWFGWGRDNLSRIRGIDADLEQRLHAAGIKTYREIETLTPADETLLEDRLALAKGRIAREGWREQAEMLRTGHEDEHTRRFA